MNIPADLRSVQYQRNLAGIAEFSPAAAQVAPDTRANEVDLALGIHSS